MKVCKECRNRSLRPWVLKFGVTQDFFFQVVKTSTQVRNTSYGNKGVRVNVRVSVITIMVQLSQWLLRLPVAKFDSFESL